MQKKRQKQYHFINPQRMREGYSSQFVCPSVCLSVCLSVTSTLEPAAIRTLQLQSQRCLDATLQCLYCVDFLIIALERRHDLYSYYTRTYQPFYSHTPQIASLQLSPPELRSILQQSFQA